MTETPENIPQANQVLYSIKLVSGEELMCTLIDSNEDCLTIESPILIRSVPVLQEDGSFNNKLNTQSWMPYAANRIFGLPLGSVLALAQLHPDLHKFYTKMVNKYECFDTDKSYTEPSKASFLVDAVDTIQ
jgi:hypothetical protein